MDEKVELVGFDENFLKQSFLWLTDPEIKSLTMTPDITVNQQYEWFKQLSYRSDYYIKGISYNGKPIGAVGIKHIDGEKGEYWGYIGEKKYIGRGIGKRMVSEMCAYGIRIGLKKLYLQVAEYNIRAIGLYKHAGFTVCSLQKKVLYMEKKLTADNEDDK